MEIKKDEKRETTRKVLSPTVAKDIMVVFNPNEPITNKLLVVDNQFYQTVNEIVEKKSYSFMPYLLPNTVFHADEKYQRDISNYKIKLSPYNLLESACTAAKQMYYDYGMQLPRVIDSQFLIQAYYIYTTLCVLVTSNGEISLITACPSVLNQLPLLQHNIDDVKERISVPSDDISNGLIQCVELVPKLIGYDIKPAIVNANKPGYVIMPKAWLDYLVDNIYRLLEFSKCRITFWKSDNSPVTIVASNKQTRSDLKLNLMCDFIKNEPKKYGVIQCVNVVERVIELFPITDFVKLEVVKDL